jgi:hypothetical protein
VKMPVMGVVLDDVSFLVVFWMEGVMCTKRL